MIPQLDLNNFLNTSVFVIFFILIFIQMIKKLFVTVVEKNISEQKEYLLLIDLQQRMYERQRDFLENKIKQTEKEINHKYLYTQEKLFIEIDESLLVYQNLLEQEYKKKINNEKIFLLEKYQPDKIKDAILNYYNKEKLC